MAKWFVLFVIINSWVQISLSLNITEIYVENLIDHFDPANNNTYKQRIWICPDYFDKTKGTILFDLGGEGPGGFPANSFEMQIAYELNAYVISAEHRFYGKSQPAENFSFDNLQYLSHDQALADYAVIISDFRDNVTREFNLTYKIPVLVVGGSYSGALSGWMRLKYPHLIDAAYVSSGVVNSIENFNMFDGQEIIATNKEDPDCQNLIRWYLSDAKTRWFANNTEKFKLQMFYNSPYLEWDDFMFYISDLFGESIQYGSRSILCLFLKNESTLPSEDRHHNLYNFGLNHRVNPFDYAFNFLRMIESSDELGSRQWTYQFCSSLGYFNTPFQPNNNLRYSEMDLDYWKRYCYKSFGQHIYADCDHTNALYGDLRISDSINQLYFTNGLDDPWQWATVRIINDTSTVNKALIINCDNCGHCVDLHRSKTSDPDVLKDARNSILSTFKQWIAH